MGIVFPLAFAFAKYDANPVSEIETPPAASFDRVTSMPEYDFEIPDLDKPATEYAYMTQDWVVYYPISSEDRHVLECIVQGEAGGESFEGKMWVATCLLNAMRREGGASASYIRTQYQYAGWNENISDDTISAVSRVFDDGEVMHDTVLWFYAPKTCTSRWHESQQFVTEIGGHRLFAPW
jgi:hypothetical protein